MRKALVLLFVLALVPFGLAQAPPGCSAWNQTVTPSNTPGLGFTDGGNAQHLTGEHFDTGSFSGICAYSGPPTGSACAVVARTSVTYTATDTGITPLFYHIVKPAIITGVAVSPNGGQTNAMAQFEAAADSCTSSSCAFSVSISGSSPQGFGGSFSTNTTPLWKSALHQFPLNCAPENAPSCSPAGGPPTQPGTSGGFWQWTPSLCEWVYECYPGDSCTGGGGDTGPGGGGGPGF